MELYGFSGSYFLKNGDIWLLREHVAKNGVIHFSHFCHDYVIEDCSK